MPAPVAERLTIVGLGLIGGSVALAARQRGAVAEIWGVDPDPTTREDALSRKIADKVFPDPATTPFDAGIVLLATPVASLPGLVRGIAKRLAPPAILTDVGSVKGPIVRALEDTGVKGVGGHPIAGRERSGIGAASPDLFADAVVVLTPGAGTDPDALAAVTALWGRLGSRVIRMEADEHDRIFAAVSHLPHIVAYALVGMLLDREAGGERCLEYAAGGLRDFTRVAMSDPIMWRDICLENRDFLLARIQDFRGVLQRVEEMIEARDGEGLSRAFARARSVRRMIQERGS